MEVLKIEGLSKIFGSGHLEVRALEDINLSISEGDFVALMGPSGSGKTTLLLCISLILDPTAGKIEFDGQTIFQKNGWAGTDIRRVRREKIGFIFQSHNLIPFLTAKQNVLFPLSLVGLKGEEAESRAMELLKYMEIADRADYLPARLSGGEQQRVAIARAVVMSPALLLADEPTGNLDSTSGGEIINLMEQMNRSGLTLLVVTHDPRIGERACRRIQLSDGDVVSDERLRPVPAGKPSS